MQLTINGKKTCVSEGSTVHSLLQELGLRGPLAVELNRKVCPRKLHAETPLNNGDVVEIVTIVGGG